MDVAPMMLFPPFSNMYAMSSVCDPTYKDKPVVLSECFREETKLLAMNVMRTAKIARGCRSTDWVYDYRSD